MAIETSQLQTLVTVAMAGSFSKAAEELGVTQSAISQSVKNLERKIGISLFKRSGKRVVLTLEGEKLYKLAHNFLSRLGDTLEEIKEDKDSMTGKVRIGTLAGVGKSWLAPEMEEFAKENPKLTLSLSFGFQEDLVSDFENYRLDFLILPEEVLPNVGERVLLGEEHSILVYPDSDQFQITEKTSLDELANYPTILFQEKGDSLYLKWCTAQYGKTPKKINNRYIINSHSNMLSAVDKGLGLAVIPLHVLRRSYYQDKVKILKNSIVSNGKFYVVYHKNTKGLMRIEKTLERLTLNKNPLSMEK